MMEGFPRRLQGIRRRPTTHRLGRHRSGSRKERASMTSAGQADVNQSSGGHASTAVGVGHVAAAGVATELTAAAWMMRKRWEPRMALGPARCAGVEPVRSRTRATWARRPSSDGSWSAGTWASWSCARASSGGGGGASGATHLESEQSGIDDHDGRVDGQGDHRVTAFDDDLARPERGLAAERHELTADAVRRRIGVRDGEGETPGPASVIAEEQVRLLSGGEATCQHPV